MSLSILLALRSTCLFTLLNIFIYFLMVRVMGVGGGGTFADVWNVIYFFFILLFPMLFEYVVHTDHIEQRSQGLFLVLRSVRTVETIYRRPRRLTYHRRRRVKAAWKLWTMTSTSRSRYGRWPRQVIGLNKGLDVDLDIKAKVRF